MKTLSDFSIKDPNGTGLGVLNVPALMRLSDDEFLEILDNTSAAYLEEHKRYPACGECENGIARPENLVRYEGVNLHALCFVARYTRERPERDSSKFEADKRFVVYFDRVFRLIGQRVQSQE